MTLVIATAASIGVGRRIVFQEKGIFVFSFGEEISDKALKERLSGARHFAMYVKHCCKYKKDTRSANM